MPFEKTSEEPVPPLLQRSANINILLDEEEYNEQNDYLELPELTDHKKVVGVVGSMLFLSNLIIAVIILFLIIAAPSIYYVFLIVSGFFAVKAMLVFLIILSSLMKWIVLIFITTFCYCVFTAVEIIALCGCFIFEISVPEFRFIWVFVLWGVLELVNLYYIVQCADRFLYLAKQSHLNEPIESHYEMTDTSDENERMQQIMDCI